jgi:hypothetical protein
MKKIVALGISALLAVPAAGSVEAHDNSGSYWQFSGSNSRAYANFDSGSGDIRVKQTCWTSGGNGYSYYGPWVGHSTNSFSPVWCYSPNTSKTYAERH